MIVGQVSATLNLNKYDNVVIYGHIVSGGNVIRQMAEQNRRMLGISTEIIV